jgi:hypothetical protein
MDRCHFAELEVQLRRQLAAFNLAASEIDSLTVIQGRARQRRSHSSLQTTEHVAEGSLGIHLPIKKSPLADDP